MSVIMSRHNNVPSDQSPVSVVPVRLKTATSQSPSIEQTKDNAENVKNCCRVFVELMFTQVGVGCLLISYTILGALAFQYLETLEPVDLISQVNLTRNDVVIDLWNVTDTYNTLNPKLWQFKTTFILEQYQEDLIFKIKEGYDSRTVEEKWTFPSALMFTLSVITMIGYGNLVPSTKWGKIVTMLYAVCGIPVYFIYFMNMGKVLANIFKWLYRKVYYCAVYRKRLSQYEVMENDLEELNSMKREEEVLIPSTACIWVMLFYITLGTVMFAEWEQWDYLDSCYFCVTSLLKIGLGDFVPGTHADKNLEVNQMKLYVSFLYLLLGLGVVSMNYYLLKEEVMVRMSQIRKKLTEFRAKIKFSLQKTLK